MPTSLLYTSGYPISDLDLGPFGTFARTVKAGPPRADENAFYAQFEVSVWESPGVLAKIPWLQNPYPVFPKADSTTPIDAATGEYAFGEVIDGINFIDEKTHTENLLNTVPSTPFWEGLVDKLDSVGIKRFDRHPSI